MRWSLLSSLLGAIAPATAGQAQPNVGDRVQQYGAYVRARFEPYFRAAGVNYPPSRVVLLGLKLESRLEVYAESTPGELRFIRHYRIENASGLLGPKMMAGDRQVPEGIYKVDRLNPNSRFHLSLGLNYPNQFDRDMAWEDGRTTLGGDIFIHGGNSSVGCLAMGDAVSEELFVLAAVTAPGDVDVILSPRDFRVSRRVYRQRRLPDWTVLLYRDIAGAILRLPKNPLDSRRIR